MKYLQGTPHSLPVRARYGVSLVSSKDDISEGFRADIRSQGLVYCRLGDEVPLWVLILACVQLGPLTLCFLYGVMYQNGVYQHPYGVLGLPTHFDKKGHFMD